MSRRNSFALPLAVVSTIILTLARLGHADGPTHELRKTEPKVVAGAKGNASLTIAARNGWHVNDEAPITLSLATSDAGLTVTKPKLGRADLVESTKDAARFDIAFVTSDPGKKTITAEAKFVMCQETACKPVKETLAFNIEVTPPGAAPIAKSEGKSKKK
jgi:hypothetical protein